MTRRFFESSPPQSSLERVAAYLLEDPTIDDCTLLERETVAGERQIIAYVVTAGSFSAGRAEARLKEVVGESMLPAA